MLRYVLSMNINKSIDSLVTVIESKSKASYEPNQNICSELGKISLDLLIGPYCVGKNTLMDAVVAQNNEFGVVRSFTTRPQRFDEPSDSYRFINHDIDSLEEVVSKLNEGELVQVAVHPYSRKVYGSELEDYNKPHMMIDMLASAVSSTMKLPFKNVTVTNIVTPVDDFKRRSTVRSESNPNDDIKARRVEAIKSLEWSLSEGLLNPWIINADGLLQVATDSFVQSVRGELLSSIGAIIIGQELLTELKKY